MTAKFLGTDYEYMMWLDADIEFTPEDVSKLWNMDADVAVGIYCMKKPDEQWFAAWIKGELVKDLDQFGDNPIEVDYAGTGFMLIKRNVVETLAKSLGDYQGNEGRTPAMYQTPIWNDGLLSEDYFFCREARAAGFKVMADPTVRLVHWGLYGYGSQANRL